MGVLAIGFRVIFKRFRRWLLMN